MQPKSTGKFVKLYIIRIEAGSQPAILIGFKFALSIDWHLVIFHSHHMHPPNYNYRSLTRGLSLMAVSSLVDLSQQIQKLVA